MSQPRRVVLLLLAAHLASSSTVLAQTAPSRQNTGGNRAPAADEDEEEEEETPPARTGGGGNTANRPQQGSNATQTPRPATPAGPDNRPNDYASNETEEARDARRERMLPRFSALNGSIGLLHLSTAEAGSDQTFRFGTYFEGYSGEGFLRPPTDTGSRVRDNAGHIGSTFTLSYSPLRYLDIFASMRAFANRNDTERPNLFQVLGDGQIGVKGVFAPVRGLHLGASAAMLILNRSGDIGVALASTSADFRLMTTVDLVQMTGTIPLRFHLNLGYEIDNSALLVADVENARRRASPGYVQSICDRPQSTSGSDPRNVGETGRACNLEISRAERFGLGISRSDRFTVRIGTDLVIPSFPYLRPWIEWNLPIPVNRQGYVCFPFSTGAGDTDSCLGSANISLLGSSPSDLTIGLRAMPPIRGLSAMLAIDIGTTGTGAPFVREVVPNTPWMLYGGLGFAHDFAPVVRRIEVPRDVVREVRVDNTPLSGRIIGAVTDADTRRPIPNAVVEVTGHPDFGLVASDTQGRYRSQAIPPGEYELRVRAADFLDGTCRGTIPQPQGESRTAADTTVDCALRPVARQGNISGHVMNNGQPVGNVIVTAAPGPGIQVPQGQQAPVAQTVTTGADGAFSFQNLLAGTWNLSAGPSPQTSSSAPQPTEVRARETANAELSVTAANPLRIVRGQISLGGQNIHFQTDSAEILPDSQTLLTRIADTISRHPEISSIEIQGHTDNRGTPQRNLQLSQSRAESVRSALVTLGVAPERLTARGYGQTRPIAPNITERGRAANRRVVFQIAGRAAAAPRR